MKELLFVRHAETDMKGRYCGHANPPVNAAGHAQIATLVREWKDASFDIISSDLQRAVTTAHALAQAGDAQLIIRPGLREICFGEWEAHSWDEIEGQNAAFAQRWLNAFPVMTAPGGESFASFQARVRGELSRILSDEEHNRIAIVTHAGVLREVLQALNGLTENEAYATSLPYCSWFTYAADGVRWNPRMHTPQIDLGAIRRT